MVRRALRLVARGVNRPSPYKRRSEDAFCTLPTAVAVADGVGGWAAHGIDPGVYARALCAGVDVASVRTKPTPPTPASIVDPPLLIDPQEDGAADDPALKPTAKPTKTTPTVTRRGRRNLAGRLVQQAQDYALVQPDCQRGGSATLCVLALGSGSTGYVANLGDSGLIVVRQGRVVMRTDAQQHSHNFPYQLGAAGHGDDPASAETASVRLRAGDIVVAASDGLWDNVFESDVVRAVVQAGLHDATLTGEEDLLACAERLTGAALWASGALGPTPWSRSGGSGVGKPDDTTCVVGRIELNDVDRAGITRTVDRTPPRATATKAAAVAAASDR